MCSRCAAVKMDVPDSCGVDPYNGTHHCSGLHANSHLSADGFLSNRTAHSSFDNHAGW